MLPPSLRDPKDRLKKRRGLARGLKQPQAGVDVGQVGLCLSDQPFIVGDCAGNLVALPAKRPNCNRFNKPRRYENPGQFLPAFAP